MSEPFVLIVEDEPALADIVRDYVVQAGMRAEILTSGEGAVEAILQQRPDLVVLDVMLPGKDGMTICREVRARSDVPIIMETARVEEIDRLLGLELGADDYICKPYSPRELVARIKANLRRTLRSGEQRTAETSPLVLDPEGWTASVGGTPVEFTRREFQLLTVLCNRPHRVFSRSQILSLAFPDDHDVFDRTIDSHIKNIRRKIAEVDASLELIRSVYGVGYAYEP